MLSRLLPYILSVVFLLSVSACKKDWNNKDMAEFDSLESIMESDPDSAYSLLCRFDKNNLNTGRDTAIFRLLWAEGRYKTFHDDTVSDGIDRCVDYFRNSGERRNLMRALYYQGIIRKNAGKYGDAILSFLESQEYVDTAEPFHMGNLHRELGELAGDIGDWSRQEEESRKAMECYRTLDSLVFIEDAQLWYATSLTENNKVDEGIELMKDLFDRAKERNDSDLLLKSASHIGNAYLWKKDYRNSREYFGFIYNGPFAARMELRDKNLLLLSMIEDNVCMDSITELAWEITKEGGVVTYEYYQRIGDYKNAYNSLRHYYYNLDAKYGKITKDKVGFIISDYQSKKVDAAKKELELTRERNMWIIIASVLLVVIIVITFILLLNKKSKKINELLALVSLLSKSAEKVGKEDNPDDAGASFKMLKMIFGSLDVLYSEYYKAIDGEKCRKGLLSRMGEEVEKLRSDDEILKGFESEINKESDGLLESVYSGFNRRPTADQRRLVVFLYLNISVDALCLLLDVNTEALYNRKTRLIKRLSESVSPRKEELISLIGSKHNS